ncbi:conjugal transfer protein TraA [Ensifer sp. ENS02]|uniref:conjugal transfer protein TraA n=1 Tax=Ensifer sp. ENS02 TaxID=2769290 RepID=UPI0017818D47|nr:conjugal transfer protein TraA [Ensifer sp. ENS02]MBD9524253.1 conjugal transfer protein TraA [Ensifer sp. ENS02]
MEIFFGAFTSEWEQRRAALLHEMASGGRGAAAEEEMRKRLKQMAQLGAGGGGGSGGAGGTGSKIRSALRSQAMPAAAGRPMEARLAAIAKGSQPAVVKMASYGGGARVGAMLNYVSRSGELKVEDENGRILEGREDLARVRGDWDYLFQNRAESRDIASFRVEITAAGLQSTDALHEQVRSTLSSGFGDRRYGYTIAKIADRSISVTGLVVLRSGQGERLTGDVKAAGIVQHRYDVSAAASAAGATFTFQGYGNGVEFGASRLRDLVEHHQDVRDDRGRPVSDEKAAGDLVLKEWRGELHSRKSRDVMHVIMSARAGTDVAAFERAARDFLAHQFSGHRYVFAMHDPASDPKEAGEGGKRPHVHAHAIVAMRSDAGDRIETTPAVFREWRSAMAEKAREHGIQMEMTDRREFASPPAFTRTQVRPVSHNGRTEHVGTSEPAQARYDAKRGGRLTTAKSDRSRQYIILARESWQKVALASEDRHAVSYAIQHKKYLETGISAPTMPGDARVIHADFGSNFRANLVTFQEMVLEGQELRETTRAEFEAYEKRVETALFKLERTVAPDARADFDEVAGLARDFVNQKRELVELYEQRKEALAEQVSEEARDPVNEEWDAAIAKHGETVVEAGNEALIDIEHYRQGLDRIEASEFSADSRQAMQAGLAQAIQRAAQMAIEGNSYLRDVAEQDPGLQRAIDQVENYADSPSEAKDKAGTSTAEEEQKRDLRAEEADRKPIDDDAREAHELASTVDATNRLEDRLHEDRGAAQRTGETTRTDPAQQHIPRLEELEQEQIEQKERDRDDRDR